MSKPIACECGHVKSSHENNGSGNCTFSQCSCKKFFTGISKTTKEIASKISARQILQTNRIDPTRMIEHFKNQKSKSNKIEIFEINKHLVIVVTKNIN